MLRPVVYLVYNINIYFVYAFVSTSIALRSIWVEGGGESMSVGVSNMSALAAK